MILVDFPTPQFQVRPGPNGDTIFDSLRRKWLSLTPEEWVRQNFVQYLVQVMKYPAALIALEKKIKLGELTKRFDILVYDREHKPWMIVECKGNEIKLGDDTLQQALRYNISVPVKYIVITNGRTTFGWERTDRLENLSSLPFFE